MWDLLTQSWICGRMPASLIGPDQSSWQVPSVAFNTSRGMGLRSKWP